MTQTTPIDLAPNSKRSLSLTGPLILASGQLVDPGIDGLGAIVTLPLTLRARHGAPEPRVLSVPGGMLVRTGAANPGLERVLRKHAQAWQASRIPVIVACAVQGAEHWGEMAGRLERVAGVGGMELLVNPTLNAEAAIRALRAVTELPLLVKLELERAEETARGCVAAGANALVIGRPPRGMALVDGRPWYGRLYSPQVKALVLNAVALVAAARLGVPLVACGGVHSAQDVREFLAAGACAVEIDSAAWIQPQLPTQIAAELQASFAGAGP